MKKFQLFLLILLALTAGAANRKWQVLIDKKSTVREALEISVSGIMPKENKNVVLNGSKPFAFKCSAQSISQDNTEPAEISQTILKLCKNPHSREY